MKNTILCACLFLLTNTAWAESASQPETQQRVAMKDGKITIHMQGNQYESGVQFDLSDPDMVLTIETDSAEPIYTNESQEESSFPLSEETAPPTEDDVPSQKGNGDEPVSPFNEARSLALKLEAQENAVKGDFNAALTLLEQAQPLTETPENILATKGSVLYKLGKIEDAIIAWQQALKHNPDLPEVKRMMKWLEK